MNETEAPQKPKRRLALRLVLYILVVSSLITLILTGLQLYRDYKIEVSAITNLLRQIEVSNVSSISDDLWVVNRRAIEVKIKGLQALQDIQYVHVIDNDGQLVAEAGTPVEENIIAREFPLSYQHRGRELTIGTLRTVASLEGVHQRLLDRVVVILVSQAAKTFLVSAFIFVLFQFLVTKHLSAIAAYVSNIRVHGDEAELSLDRKVTRNNRGDEFEQVVDAINAMQHDLQASYRELLQHRDHLEQLVKLRTRELEFKNRELIAFCYSVSHDLRTPLRGINGFSQLLLEDYGEQLEGEAKSHLERICHAAERMGELMDDLLRLSRVSQIELHFEKIDLTGMANSIHKVLSDHHPDRAVECVVQKGMQLTGDRGAIRLALENLIGNAWKYTSNTDEPKIEIGCEIIDDRQVFHVRDNGAGFDMKYVGKLFKPFERLHSNREFEGTGIGLATVDRVFDRHGGRIWAEGKPGEGSVFYFMMPDSPHDYLLPRGESHRAADSGDDDLS